MPLIPLALIAILLIAQSVRALGWLRGGLLGGAVSGLILGGAAFLLWPRSHVETVDLAKVPYVTSDTCLKCHPSHHASWHRSYHRTMTREATPENVKGDFSNKTVKVGGVTSRLTREGDRFFMETADPTWGRRMADSGKPPEEWRPQQLKKFEVSRLVGSHWFQECMYRDPAGRYLRLPLSYHIVEQRWVHTNGAFLSPDTNEFWDKSTVWNESCVYCHNTKPSKRPGQRILVKGERVPSGYDTRVAELGIACEACHGPGEEHVRVNQDPARRFALQQSGQSDPTIINPSKLTAQRSSEICGHCHGASVPHGDAWGPMHTDPYTAGDDLERFLFIFWSEAEQKQLYERPQRERPPLPPAPLDGRFWGDGTPLTTAVEYQGMALSKCFEEGRGRLTCLSCHSLHDSNPNFQLGRRMETNEACYQCHANYREKLTAHTHHAADSAGSLCYNCHMPYQVYSLLTTHRTHRIHNPLVKDSVGTGKPHACNLCHLDKSLGWTQEQLVKWYGHQPASLSEDEQRISSAVLHLLQSDARSRAVTAGAFSWPPAQEVSGTDWMGSVLLTVLERDRYPAVRYLGHRALRTLNDESTGGYDYMASPLVRDAQLGVLRQALLKRPRPDPARHGAIPLTAGGDLDMTKMNEFLQKRNDPDVSIHE